MPLLETVGSSSSRGFGMFGKTEYPINAIYLSANLYAPLVDSTIFSLGARSTSQINIVSGASYLNDQVNTSRKVLQGDGAVGVKVPGGNPGSTHTVSIWQRARTGGQSGMLLSKFLYSDDSDTTGTGPIYPASGGNKTYPLDIWDEGATSTNHIVFNMGDGGANKVTQSQGINFNTTTWTHWAFTFDGSTARLYRNGSYIGPQSSYYTSWSSYVGSWTIGSWAGVGQFANYVLGSSNFSNFAVWNNTVKNSADITNIYSAGPSI